MAERLGAGDGAGDARRRDGGGSRPVRLPEHAGLVGDSLFDSEEESTRSADRDALRERLSGLAQRRVFIGGSSWKYPGWLGQIYSRSRYQVRGRFSKKRFEETCLAEYATVFPAVCGDFAFYQFPAGPFWAKLFAQTPGRFRWGLKVPEQITCARWPAQARYGAAAGLDNPSYLDDAMFVDQFLAPLGQWRGQVGALIFEFGAVGNKGGGPEFVKALDGFLRRLPAVWNYAVEIRTPEFLTPDYFACLRAHGVTHVFNAWARMPEISEQMAIEGAWTSDLIVCRALLKRGRSYEEAVQRFAPYDRVREVNERVRRALREMIDVAIVDGRPAFIFVNNRLEGNSPGTIIAITDDIEAA